MFLLFSALGITFDLVLLDWARIHEHLTEENVLVADEFFFYLLWLSTGKACQTVSFKRRSNQ